MLSNIQIGFGVVLWIQGLDLVILVVPFELRIFCDPMKNPRFICFQVEMELKADVSEGYKGKQRECTPLIKKKTEP